jgi:hypothetical protein
MITLHEYRFLGSSRGISCHSRATLHSRHPHLISDRIRLSRCAKLVPSLEDGKVKVEGCTPSRSGILNLSVLCPDLFVLGGSNPVVQVLHRNF